MTAKNRHMDYSSDLVSRAIRDQKPAEAARFLLDVLFPTWAESTQAAVALCLAEFRLHGRFNPATPVEVRCLAVHSALTWLFHEPDLEEFRRAVILFGDLFREDVAREKAEGALSDHAC